MITYTIEFESSDEANIDVPAGNVTSVGIGKEGIYLHLKEHEFILLPWHRIKRVTGKHDGSS